ncbi:MAG: UvrD-helicase domain-containing protein [Proteobacteria bacterium]|nr:UvrD-helicase domain-containing protein [Pseudomonadota bacterium]MDA0965458.1 UvrD-helicase domain-containing protein [Pseudomonadota bacterium]
MNKQDTSDTLSKDLNEEQFEAVTQIDGPLLVLAGAGTGKTKVLTYRIANILMNGTFPSRILAVTFTNKAAKEMSNRILSLVGERSEGLWLGTFHSIGAKILRRHAEAVGLKSNFTIIDTSDQLRLIKQIFADHKIDEKRWDPKQQMHIINSWKDRGLTPDKVTANDIIDFAGGKSLEIYKDYQSRLRGLNAADFGDLLLHNVTIFNENPDILADYQRQFKYILVDEYQDTNIGQYLWLRLLAQKNKNICCVGDDDQSIYGWRGAEVGNILRFERDFAGAKVVRLERNYRSTSHILSAASHLISKNSDRLGKTLWTQDNEGEPIKLLLTWDDKEEAKQVAEEIEALQQIKRHGLNQMAILVRAGFQTRAFEECFMNRGIPYKVIGGLRFYERMEIKDLISYIRVTAQPDDSLALERVINIPKRGIGSSTLQSIYETSRLYGISMFESIKLMLSEDSFKPKISKTLSDLTNDFVRWGNLAKEMTVAEFAEVIAKESGYISMWKQDASLEAQGRLDNIKELLRALEEFESIEEFLEHVSLVSDIDNLNHDNMVSIMTLHAAKGLEFDTVFLPGWEEGTFPHQRAIDDKAKSGLEEERRLAYVGITRARKNLYILSAANRRIYGQYQSSIPSRFIEELPQENIEKINLNNGFNFPAPSSNFEDGASYSPKPSPYAPAKKTSTGTAKTSPEGFSVGKKVSHPKFGNGIVLNVNGDQLEIAFEGMGIKKVIDRYVTAN